MRIKGGGACLDASDPHECGLVRVVLQRLGDHEAMTSEGDDWAGLCCWVEEAQTLSSDPAAYPLARDSLLAGDTRGMPNGISVASVARAFLDSAVNDLATAVSSITAGHIHPVGLATLTRGSVELAGVGMWVLTGSKRQGRQQRALRVAHDSAFNATKFFEGLTDTSNPPEGLSQESAQGAQNYRNTCDQITTAAMALGIKKTTVTARLDRTGHLKSVDAARGTNFYQKWQLCSGYAHGLAWAPGIFNRHLYAHEMEGGGSLQGSHLPEDRAFAMLTWGRQAIEELRGTFAAGRISMPGFGEDATLFSGNPEQAQELLGN